MPNVMFAVVFAAVCAAGGGSGGGGAINPQLGQLVDKLFEFIPPEDGCLGGGQLRGVMVRTLGNTVASCTCMCPRRRLSRARTHTVCRVKGWFGYLGAPLPCPNSQSPTRTRIHA